MTEPPALESVPSIPCCVDAEEALLGSILIDPGCLSDIRAIISDPGDFYIHRNRWVWETLCHLDDQRIPIDILTITTELDRRGQLAEIGGPAFLTALMGQSPTSLHAEAYANQVRAYGLRRSWLDSANKIAKLAYDDRCIDEVQGSVSEVTMQIAMGSVGRREYTTAVLAERHAAMVEENSEKEDLVLGIPTGLRDIDAILGGGLKKKYMLLVGDPGSGKTSLVLQWALSAAEAGKHVGIWSNDMDDADQLTNIMLSIMAGIDNQRLEAGRLNDEEWAKYIQANDKFGTLPIHIIDQLQEPMTIQSIRAKGLSLRMKDELDYAIVDCMTNVMAHEGTDEHNRINMVSRDFQLLKNELDIPLTVVHHTNRQLQQRAGREPKLSDIREGGEASPGIVAFLYEPEDAISTNNGAPRRWYVAKHRGGPAFVYADLFFLPKCTRFQDGITKAIGVEY